MKLRQYTHSIGATLLGWFLALSLVPLLSVAWYGYVQTAQSVNEMQRSKLADSAALNVTTLHDRFYGAVRDLESWSQLRTPLDILSAVSLRFAQSGQDLGVFIHSTEYEKIIAVQPMTVLKLAKHYDYVYDLFLIDLEGNILYTVKKESDLGTNLLNGPYSKTRFAQAYRRSLEDGKAHFSDLEHYGPSQGVLTGFITQPIRDDSGKMIGIMGLQLNMKALFDPKKIQNSGIHQYLVGGDGLLRTSMERESDVLSRRISTEIFWSWYKEHGMRGHFSDTMDETASVYAGPNGKKVLGEHKSINLLGVRWAHISEIDESEVLAVPHRLFIAILIFSLIVAGVVIVAAIMIARRIVQPITQLSSASEQYMNGVKGVKVTLDATNEIGEFGELFNALIHKQEADDEKLAFLAKKAQKTLDELKEQKYALDAHSIVAITDVKGTITFVNSKFEEISGYSSDELIGKNHRILNSGCAWNRVLERDVPHRESWGYMAWRSVQYSQRRITITGLIRPSSLLWRRW